MKLLRYGEIGQERPGVLDPAGGVRSLEAILGPGGDIGPALLADPGRLAALRALDPDALPAIAPGTRLGCPVAGIGKVVGIGLNYHDHALECGLEIPKEPIIFLKATTALSGPGDDIVLPEGGRKADWEAELGVVIGRTARRVAPEAALGHVAGYCVAHDLSERAHQLEHGGQWTKGKSHDGFCPVGPWLVTADEVPDPQALDLWLEVDGVSRQSSSTGQMIFPVAFLISYVSRFMTLMPGDLVITGTPAGVGLGRTPPVFLKPGNRVRLGVTGLGEQHQRVV